MRVTIKNLKNMLKCIRSGEQIKAEENDGSSDSLATRDYSASGYSLRPGDPDPKLDSTNIEEAETSLRESGYLNYEEARALLGRLEYQKGNIEAALHVFEGIDILSVGPKMKTAISRRCEQNRRRSSNDATTVPVMSMHAVSLLLEAIFLKAKSLQRLGRYEEAARSCKIMLDTVEAALPEGLNEYFTSERKLHETMSKAVELIPELWKLAGALQEAILSYRRALLYKWSLDAETRAKVEKKFAVFLLYGGCEAAPPELRSQMDASFTPMNNLEEAVLLLLVLLRRALHGKVQWDPSVLDHLSFALSVSGKLTSLAHQVETVFPSTMERRERFFVLALCYHAEGKDSVALNLLKTVLNDRRRRKSCARTELLLASKICGENGISIDEGITYARKALSERNRCRETWSVSNCLLGVALSAKSRSVVSDPERVSLRDEAVSLLEEASQGSAYAVFHLCLEHAEQRRLDRAVHYARQLVRHEAGSSVRGYALLARVLSAQKQFTDAEAVIDMAIAQSGKLEHGELLQTKARLQTEQDRLRPAVETYTCLLAVLQVQFKSIGAEKRLVKNREKHNQRLEMETWHDLCKVYMRLWQWRDAEVCLSRSIAIDPHSTSRWHCSGLLDEAKGFHQEALKSYREALDMDPTHVPSLISTARILRHLGGESLPVVRSFLMDALRIDRTNPLAWHSLGLLYKDDPEVSSLEAAECFEAAAILEETAPVEPFRDRISHL